MGWCPVKISSLDFGLHPGVGGGGGLTHERPGLLVVLLRDANQRLMSRTKEGKK